MNRGGEFETTAVGTPRSRSVGDQLQRPGHRLDPALELGEDELVELGDQLGVAPGSSSWRARIAPAIGAEVPTSSCLWASVNSQPAAGEQLLLGPGPHRLGVEQEPVVVEDHRRRRSARAQACSRRQPPVAVAEQEADDGAREPRRAGDPGDPALELEPEPVGDAAGALALGLDDPLVLPDGEAQRPRALEEAAAGLELGQAEVVVVDRAARRRAGSSCGPSGTPTSTVVDRLAAQSRRASSSAGSAPARR